MNPRTAFVAGWPVAHSRSPLIHRFWLASHGIDGDYVREAVSPEAADAFVRGFGARGFVGGNLTVPHKEAAFRACDAATAVGRRLGAVNTVWLEGGRIRGDNTDVYGFSASLDDGAPDWRGGSSALVIGAGGASRAILLALLDGGYGVIHVVNRSRERAETLAGHFGDAIRIGSLQDIPRLLRECRLVVNATSAGLAGQESFDMDWSGAHPDAIATDIVYAPLVTPFLQGAARQGLRTVDGLGMLMHQAAPGFERWFGVRPQVDRELRRLLEADLGG